MRPCQPTETEVRGIKGLGTHKLETKTRLRSTTATTAILIVLGPSQYESWGVMYTNNRCPRVESFV